MSTKHARTKRRSEVGELGKRRRSLYCLFNGFKNKSPNAWEDARKCSDRATTANQRCSRHRRSRHVISSLASCLTPMLKGYAVHYESRPSRRFMALQLSECILSSIGQNRAGRVVWFCQRMACEVIMRMSSFSDALSECLSASLCQKEHQVRPHQAYCVHYQETKLELQAYHGLRKQNNPIFFKK
jgi:hypothetical protein